MMYYEQGEEKFGVLNDFDLAAIMDVGDRSPKKQGFERTGTLPFMAIDLLDAPDGKMPRWFRHDLESCMWCLIWQSLEKIDKRWYSHDASEVSLIKIQMLSSFAVNLLKPEWKPYNLFLRHWIRTFASRREHRLDIAYPLETAKEKYEAWIATDKSTKNEDFMRPDSKGAKDLLAKSGLNRKVEALLDLGWIEVKVDGPPTAENGGTSGVKQGEESQ